MRRVEEKTHHPAKSFSLETPPNKKGAGRIFHSPRMDSRFAMSDMTLCLPNVVGISALPKNFET